MSIQGVEPSLVIVDELTSADDESNHYTCCNDDMVAVCGIDLSRHGWIGDDEEIDCATCVRLCDADADWVPMSDSERCPHCPLNVLDLGGTR